MKTVTKKDVAKRTAKALNEKIYTTEKFVDSIFTVLREILSEADPEIRIEIRDFGVFEVKRTKPKPKARKKISPFSKDTALPTPKTKVLRIRGPVQGKVIGARKTP